MIFIGDPKKMKTKKKSNKSKNKAQSKQEFLEVRGRLFGKHSDETIVRYIGRLRDSSSFVKVFLHQTSQQQAGTKAVRDFTFYVYMPMKAWPGKRWSANMDLIFNKLPYDSIEEIGPAKIYFGAVGVCLILFLISFFTILSAVNLERETLTKKIVDTEYTLKKYFKVVASKHEIHKNLSLKTGELNMKKKQLPSEEALSKLLVKITRLGKKRNVDIVYFKVADGMVDDFYKEIPMHFRFRGGLWETMDMFATLQNMLQIVHVKNMSFKVVNDEKTPQVLSSFIGSSYVYIDGL